jgi:hypothetical protein
MTLPGTTDDVFKAPCFIDGTPFFAPHFKHADKTIELKILNLDMFCDPLCDGKCDRLPPKDYTLGQGNIVSHGCTDCVSSHELKTNKFCSLKCPN